MAKIEEAINVGPTLAKELRRAGITTVEQLKALGHLQAWRQLQQVAPQRKCVNSCLALAGAIQGVRWMKLPAAERARIAAAVKQANAN